MKYDENDNKCHLLVRVANSHTRVVHHESTFHKFGLFGEGLNGVNRQPSNGPKINRQPSKTE